jgi:hypothetical protein
MPRDYFFLDICQLNPLNHPETPKHASAALEQPGSSGLNKACRAMFSLLPIQNLPSDSMV